MNQAPLRCVVDASVGIKLLLNEPLSDLAYSLFELLPSPGVEFWVPDLFYVECANVLWKTVRRDGLTAAVARDNLHRLADLALLSVPTQGLVEEAFDLAIRYGITAYDATYAALAQSEQIPLVTADEKLLQKLVGSGCRGHWLGAGLPPLPAA